MMNWIVLFSLIVSVSSWADDLPTLVQYERLSEKEFLQKLPQIQKALSSIEFKKSDSPDCQPVVEQYILVGSRATDLDKSTDSQAFVYNTYEEYKNEFEKCLNKMKSSTAESFRKQQALSKSWMKSSEQDIPHKAK